MWEWASSGGSSDSLSIRGDGCLRQGCLLQSWWISLCLPDIQSVWPSTELNLKRIIPIISFCWYVDFFSCSTPVVARLYPVLTMELLKSYDIQSRAEHLFPGRNSKCPGYRVTHLLTTGHHPTLVSPLSLHWWPLKASLLNRLTHVMRLR